MERKLLERMVGGGVLMIALVILGPMILDGSGSGESNEGDDVPGQRDDELRTHTFRLNQRPPADMSSPSAQVTDPASTAAPSSGAPLPPPGTIPQSPSQRLSSAAGASAPQPGPNPSGPTTALSEAAPAGQQPASLAAARPAPGSTKESAGGEWLVQVGTFGQRDNANRLVARLKERGFEAFVSTTARGGKTMYRVRVGPPGMRAAADDLASRLAAAGQAGQVVPP